ncbi:hypothetical protein SBA2_260045 [Acidobacteriia bacterium SbA2]|nr:hypothetical protein SBA2_260045 [Acidobacteriia bacterium SbA2]
MDLVDPEQHRESKRRAGGCVFFLTRFRPALPSSWGDYVDDANPSASEWRAARAVVRVGHSM